MHTRCWHCSNTKQGDGIGRAQKQQEVSLTQGIVTSRAAIHLMQMLSVFQIDRSMQPSSYAVIVCKPLVVYCATSSCKACKACVGLAGTDQQNQWLHLVLVGSRRGLSKQMQQASSVHTALGSTAVLTFPTDSGISCNQPAGVTCKLDRAFLYETDSLCCTLSNATWTMGLSNASCQCAHRKAPFMHTVEDKCNVGC